MNGPTDADFEEIYREQYQRFLRTATAIANSRESGRDAVHDAFVVALRKRHSYRGESPLEAWLWRIVVRCALKRRVRAREQLSDFDPPDALWIDPSSYGYSELRAAIARLPPRQRVALFLRYYGDLEYRTVAEVMGITPGAVGAELNMAHRALRTLLEEATSHG